MNWVNLHQDWGRPAVNLFLARRFLDVVPQGVLFDILSEDGASCARIEEWVEHLFAEQYPGVQVSGVHLMPHQDALVLTVIHPDFPRTKAYAPLPRWEILAQDADTDTPRWTIKEQGA